MSFKENLLRKIEIDRLSGKVLATIGPSDSGLRIDKDAMRRLLEMSPFVLRRERDLELYMDKTDNGQRILVLDNELPIYRTTAEDVAMRKSPFIKEMLNIRNIIKILKDSDVKISVKAESLKTVQAESIALLDMTYNATDIAQMAEEGTASLENSYADGVIETLTLFADLLAFIPAPKPFKQSHRTIFGASTEKGAEKFLFGPMVIYSLIDNTLKLIEQPLNNEDQEQLKYFQQVVSGDQEASRAGAEVFNYLKTQVPHPG